MTNKERLKRLESYSACDNYREKEEDFREIEKALEVLEILKEYDYTHDKNTLFIALDCMKYDELIKIEEWLENDQSIQ